MTSLADKIVAIERSLTAARVPHAFGGALALAFHVQEPRGTRDIDVNLFCPEVEARAAFGALPDGVRWTDADLERVAEVGQVRLFWDDTPVDVFFSTHAFHDRVAAGVAWVPFAEGTIPILDAASLAVFKAFFDRTKDWADIEAMVDAGTLDGHDALGWLVDLLGGDDQRVERLRRTIDRSRPAHDTAEPRFDPPNR
ncbi:MAG: hypothetical protein ACXWA3_17075 [Acidimicrobiales bacterium]